MVLFLEFWRELPLAYLPVSALDQTQTADDLIRPAEQVFGELRMNERSRIAEWHGHSPLNRLGLAPTRRWAFISWETTAQAR